MVVDQLAAWIAFERLGELPSTGGFARLRREGTYAHDMRYAHAATDTAPGHAALFTGAPPRVSGIYANEQPEPGFGNHSSILRDRATREVGTDGVLDRLSSSPSRIAVDTVADKLRAKHKNAAIVAVSLKDRGAIPGAGHAPTAAIWFDPGLDAFVTSTVFGSALPAWARPLAAPHATSQLRASPWVPLDGPWLRAHAKTPDDQSGEGSLEGMGAAFPHDVNGSKAPGLAFRATPFADEALLALALAAVDGEHMAERPSFLVVSLSANDYVAHTFGPDSNEAWDELLRLDGALARFFSALDAKLGSDGYAVLLAADHGSTSMPEATRVPGVRTWCDANTKAAAPRAPDRWQRPCVAGGRLYHAELATEARAAADRALGPGQWVAGVADPYLHFTDEALALSPARRALLVAAIRSSLEHHAEIDRVIDMATLPATCPDLADESADALVCRGMPTDPHAAVYILAKAGSFFDPDYVKGFGMNHGSPYLFDRSVPFLVRAPSRVAAGRVVDEPISFASYARTAAALLGVDPPSRASPGTSFVEREPATSASERP